MERLSNELDEAERKISILTESPFEFTQEELTEYLDPLRIRLDEILEELNAIISKM